MPTRREQREEAAGMADTLGRGLKSDMDRQVKRAEVPGGGGGVVGGAGVNGKRMVHGFMVERNKPIPPTVKQMMKKRLRGG